MRSEPGLVRRDLEDVGGVDLLAQIAAQGDRSERVLRGRISAELVADAGDVGHGFDCSQARHLSDEF